MTTAAAAAPVIGSVEEPVSARLPPFVVVPSSPVDDDPPAEPSEPLVELPVEPVDPPPVTSSVMSALSLALLGSNGRASVLSATEPLAPATRLSIFSSKV